MAVSRRYPVILGLLAAVLARQAWPHSPLGAALANHDLQITNRSSHSVNEIYVSPSTSDEWGDDRLGDAMIPPGGFRRLRLGRMACAVDIQVVYEDASREERHGLDLCHTRQLVFDGSAAVKPPGSEGVLHPVVIVNDASRPIQQIQVSPAEAGDWGDDLLGHDSLSVGDRATVTYRGGCLADLRVVFDNRSAEERRDLDLCALHGVSVQPGWTTADALPPLPPLPPSPGDAATAGPAAPLSVTVENRSGHAIHGLFVTQEGAAGRGADLLGSGLLDDGGQITVTLPRPQPGCRFQAHVVFGGKLAELDLPRLDLCRDPRLVVAP